MSFKSHPNILLAAITGLLLTACGAAPSQSWAGVTVSPENSTVYIAHDTHLYAIDTDGKTVRWQQPSASGGGFFDFLGGGDSTENNTSVNLAPVLADPVVVDELLIVTSYNKSVYALNIQDGTQKWVFSESADRLIAPAVVHQDTVYVSSADNSLYALDLDGALKWKFTTEASLWAAPLPTDEVIYVPSMDHNLYAVNSDGTQKWKAELNGALAGSPALSEDGRTLYVGTLNNALYALNTENGAERWTVEAKGWVWASPVVADGRVYFADLEGAVFAIDATTGVEQWSVETGGTVRGTPALAGESLIVVIDEGTVFSINIADGTNHWDSVIDANNADRLLANPIILDEAVLIVPLAAEKTIYALSLANGNELWSYKTP